MSAARAVLLLGATGLVGGHALRRLLADTTWGRVVVLTRRPLDGAIAGPTLEARVVDFTRLDDPALDLGLGGGDGRGIDDVLCALGTTIKAAGSREAFRRVDHDHVLALARRARAAGARRLALVSSVGADPGSAAFYLRTKGEVERDLAALGWESLALLRPSVLLGARRERRPGEAVGAAVGAAVSGLLLGPLRRYRPIDADVVAAAAVAALRRGAPGAQVLEHGALEALAAAVTPA